LGTIVSPDFSEYNDFLYESIDIQEVRNWLLPLWFDKLTTNGSLIQIAFYQIGN